MGHALKLVTILSLLPALTLAETKGHEGHADHGACDYHSPTYDVFAGWGGKDLASDAAFDRFFPERAIRLDQAGAVSLRCQLAAGAFRDCTVESEAPEDFGFGEAALRMTPRLTPPADLVPGPLYLRLEFRFTGNGVCKGSDCPDNCGSSYSVDVDQLIP